MPALAQLKEVELQNAWKQHAQHKHAALPFDPYTGSTVHTGPHSHLPPLSPLGHRVPSHRGNAHGHGGRGDVLPMHGAAVYPWDVSSPRSGLDSTPRMLDPRPPPPREVMWAAPPPVHAYQERPSGVERSARTGGMEYSPPPQRPDRARSEEMFPQRPSGVESRARSGGMEYSPPEGASRDLDSAGALSGDRYSERSFSGDSLGVSSRERPPPKPAPFVRPKRASREIHHSKPPSATRRPPDRRPR